MAESIYIGRKGLFFALQTVEATYVAPAASAFILTEDFQYVPQAAQRDTVNLDSLDNGFATKTMFSSHNSTFSFKVPLSWPSTAPSATAGFFAASPLFEVCGCQAPLYTAAVVGPPAIPARIQYTEQSALELIKSGSLSFRTRRTATTQLERKSAGVRGSVGMEWEIDKIPRFNFELLGSAVDMLPAASLTPAPGVQLTNIASTNVATIATARLGGKSLCLTKFSIKNLFRHKPQWVSAGCGNRAQPGFARDAEIAITCKMPNIDTEFNPDTWHGNEHALSLKLDQQVAGRSLNLDYASLQLVDWKPVDIGSEMGVELTLAQISPLIMTTE